MFKLWGSEAAREKRVEGRNGLPAPPRPWSRQERAWKTVTGPPRPPRRGVGKARSTSLLSCLGNEMQGRQRMPEDGPETVFPADRRRSRVYRPPDAEVKAG